MSYLFDSTLGVSALGTRALSQPKSIVFLEPEYLGVSINKIDWEEVDTTDLFYKGVSSFTAQGVHLIHDIVSEVSSSLYSTIDLGYVHYMSANSISASSFTGENVLDVTVTDMQSEDELTLDALHGLLHTNKIDYIGKSFFFVTDATDAFIATHYIAGFVDTPTQLPNTLGAIPCGNNTLSVYTDFAETQTVPFELIQDLTIEPMLGVGTMWTDITFLRLFWCAMEETLLNVIDMTHTVRGLDGIQFEPWVYYVTDGKFGRIHIPTDPYM